MIPTALLLILAQLPPGAPLVGDTVWIEREVAAPPGSLLRPCPWDPAPIASLLGSPVVEVRSDGWILRYPLAFWEVGRHRLQIPGPLVIRSDGRTDSLPARIVEVEIGSLVPRSRLDTVPPRPAAATLPLGELSSQPILVLGVVAVLLLVPLHWWWHRRGPVPQVVTPPMRAPTVSPATLEGWADLGEWRLVADTWIARLEDRPPGAAVDPLLAALRAARFGSDDAAVLERLCREAAAL